MPINKKMQNNYALNIIQQFHFLLHICPANKVVKNSKKIYS